MILKKIDQIVVQNKQQQQQQHTIVYVKTQYFTELLFFA